MIRTILSQTDPLNMQIDVGARKDQALFDDILAIRNEPYNHSDKSVLEFPFDVYSDQYRLLVDNKSSGCLTVTRALAGPLDCQKYYPPSLFDNYYDRIVSACKFRILSNVRMAHDGSAGRFAPSIVRSAWSDQLNKGARLDIINVQRSYIPYYSRLGYALIDNSNFVHPALGTDSFAMILPADPSRNSIARDLFEKAGDYIYLHEVKSTLSRTTVFVQGNLVANKTNSFPGCLGPKWVSRSRIHQNV